MNECQVCQKPTVNPKFCSQRCSAIQRNKKYYQDKPRKKYYCKRCSVLISIGWTLKKFCDNCNYNIVDWDTITLKDFKNKIKNNFQVHARIRSIGRALYGRNKLPKECYNCGYNKFFEVCHVKAIKDFDEDSTISQINNINNLIALCPNCHWEFDHGLLAIPQLHPSV